MAARGAANERMAAMEAASGFKRIGLAQGLGALGAAVQYGPGYRTLTHAWGGEPGALSRLRSRTMHDGTQVHPADLDDALCTSGAMGLRSDGETRLPFAVDDALLQGTRGELWAVRARANTKARLTVPCRPLLLFC